MLNDTTPPAVRVAPLGELRAYTVSEMELEQLARGGDMGLLLNFGISLVSIFASFLVTLLTVDVQGKLFTIFVNVALVSFISGAICLLIGIKQYRGTGRIVEDIKARMNEIPVGIQEQRPPFDLNKL